MSTPTPSPARPIRTKRNFKALQLDVTQPAPQPEPELIPTRNAPPAAAAAANEAAAADPTAADSTLTAGAMSI